jgi:hypothetical protein
MTTMKWSNIACKQQNNFLNLFENYKDLFSNKLGLITGPLVHLYLTPKAKQNYAKAYNIPQAIIAIGLKEIDYLKIFKLSNPMFILMGCTMSFPF